MSERNRAMMTTGSDKQRGRRYAFLVPALLLSLGLIAIDALTSRAAGQNSTEYRVPSTECFEYSVLGTRYSVLTAPDVVASTDTPTSVPTTTPFRTATPSGNDFLELVSEGGVVANGGSVPLGSRLVLGMWLDANYQPAVGQQSYLTFTNSILQNVEV